MKAHVKWSEGVSFVVESGAWLKTVLPTIYQNLDDRPGEGGVHTFPAHFVY